MENENKNPAAPASANRANFSVSSQEMNTAHLTDFQATYIANKFRISPCLARVICELAHIGGRLL